MAEEQKIEQKLVKVAKANGGLCFKFSSPGTVGVPDRILLLHHGRIAFIEVKAPGKKLKPVQAYRKRQIEELGFKVYVLDSYEQIQIIIDEMKEGK